MLLMGLGLANVQVLLVKFDWPNICMQASKPIMGMFGDCPPLLVKLLGMHQVPTVSKYYGYRACMPWGGRGQFPWAVSSHMYM